MAQNRASTEPGAVHKHFAAAAGPGTDNAFVTDLARRVARDLTAIGLAVSDYNSDEGIPPLDGHLV